MSARIFKIIPILLLTLVVILGAQVTPIHRIVADTSTTTPPTVTVTPQNSTTDSITVTFASSIPSGNIVDLELHDSNNAKVWQKFETTGGTTFTETASMPNGTYTLQLGLFTPNWASNYAWFSNLSTLTFPNSSQTPTSQTPVITTFPVSDTTEKITVSFPTAILQGNIVDIEVYNSQTPTVKAWQYSTTSGGTVFSGITTSLPAGSYLISVGLFTSNWGSNYAWFNHVCSFVIGSSSTLTPTPTQTSIQTVSPVAMTAYNDWKSKYVQAAGSGLRVVRPENNNDTVSEGMGYGMLLAEMANDQGVFQGLWNYTKQFLDNKGLMNWQINSSGAVIGGGSATDADEDITYALIKANSKWPGKGYDTAAKTMLQAMMNAEVNSIHVVSPGDNWGATQIVNPSYISLGYYPVFASFSSDSRWNTVSSSSSQFLTHAANSSTGLLPDWINSDLTPATFPSDQHVHDFWYDALRTPIRLLQAYKASGNADAKTLLQKQSTFLANATVQKLVSGYTLPGNPLSTYLDSAFMSAYAAAGQISPTSSYATSAMQKLTQTPPSGYFGTSLRAITIFFATGNN